MLKELHKSSAHKYRCKGYSEAEPQHEGWAPPSEDEAECITGFDKSPKREWDSPAGRDKMRHLAAKEREFIRLRDEWKSKRGHSSSTEELAMHPAYQAIIGMGRDAIPFLLREIAQSPDRWFWALRAITKTDPVPVKSRGNSKAMTIAWLEWGKEQGYI